MAFSSSRGRPRTSKTSSHPAGYTQPDHGTAELIFKRIFHITSEPLDLCFERGFIDVDEHWSGLHLRWLYTLCYGTVDVCARDISYMPEHPSIIDDPQWRVEREREYRTAATALCEFGLEKAILQLCVYNIAPHFLRVPNSTVGLHEVQDGLELLCELWRG